MRERGFNLFTALVAIVLVVLAAILTNTMISGERNVTNIISDIEEEQKMQTIADLSRADALHAFNFGIRFTIERWLTDDSDGDGIPDNKYHLTPEIAIKSFDEIKMDFARANFGICTQTLSGESCKGRQLATRAANHLTALLERTPDVRGFNIDLDRPNATELQELLQKVFDKSSEENEFFQVINCDGTWGGCPNGTFYITLDLRHPNEGGYLTDLEYEKFPQIVVTNRQTGRVLKEPILPRGNVQIYVPTRLFKAISGGLEIVKGDSDRLFEGTFHSEIEGLQIGICNSLTCAPVNDPERGYTIEDSGNFACAGDPLNSLGPGGLRDIILVNFQNHSYDPNRDDKMKSALKKFVQDEKLIPKINELADLYLDPHENFELVKNVNGNAAQSALAITLGTQTRRVFAAQSQQEGTAYCREVDSIEAIIVFEESDEKYIVSDVDGSGTNRYAIKLRDSRYEIAQAPNLGILPICRTQSGGFNDFTCTFEG